MVECIIQKTFHDCLIEIRHTVCHVTSKNLKKKKKLPCTSGLKGWRTFCLPLRKI